MSNVVKLRSEDERYDVAARWVARLDEDMSPADRAELQSWLAEDDRNQALLEKMAMLWDKMDSLSRLSSLFPPQRPTHSATSRKFAYGVAAAIVIGIAVGLFGSYQPTVSGGQAIVAQAQSVHAYQTAVGERSTITLVDGSELTLNTNTRAEVEFTDSYRLISLLQGEINIKVAKDSERPLSVKAGDKLVQAVGTEFNVEITDDQKIELVVTEGKVRVAVLAPKHKPDSVSEPPQPLPSDALTVAAGETLVFDDANEEAEIVDSVTPISSDDIEVKLSWRQGNLVFRGESLEDAVKEVGRYTAVEFVILDDSLKQIRVAGMFKAGDVESLLSALEANFDIVAKRTDDRRILLSTQTN